MVLIAKLDFKAKMQALLSLTPKTQLIHATCCLPNAKATDY